MNERMKAAGLLWCVALATNVFAQGTENCPMGSVIQVDGQGGEWPMEWIANEDKEFSYNVCADDNNLYVRMKTRDEWARKKIAVFGLTLWMDPNGKKKKKLGLKFPTGTEGSERMLAVSQSNDMQKMSASERANFQKKINAEFIRDIELMEIIGLSDDPLTSTRSGITNGIKVAIAADEEDAYVYEAVIPFKAFRLSKSSIAELGIGFETGKYVPDKKTKASQGPPPTGYSGSGYSGPGGSHRTTGPSYQGSGVPQMDVPSVFWTSVKLK